MTGITEVIAEIESAGCAVRIRRGPHSWADATVFAVQRIDLRALLEGMPAVASSRRRTARVISIRFDDEVVQTTGDLLFRRGVRALGDLRAPADRALVMFGDPNANKALHVGHARNMAIGDALAGLLHVGGARVVRQSIVCDVGRAAAETLAGYLTGRLGKSPEEAGLRPDEFVGRCYAAYERPGPRADLDPDILAEAQPVDRAEVVLRELRDGDPVAAEAWSRLLGWALEGHAQTIRRFGVEISRQLYESAASADVEEICTRCLELGLFERSPNGEINLVCEGEEVYRVPMVRADGVETGYARHFVFWRDAQRNCTSPTTCVNVKGDEWTRPGVAMEEGLKQLLPCPLFESYCRVAIGMVHVAGSPMKSRESNAILIEDCLDRLEAAARRRGIDDALVPSTACVALKSYLLAPSPSRRMDFSYDELLSGSQNPGWGFHQAVVDWGGRKQLPGLDAKNPEMRFAVLRAAELVPIMQRSLGAHDPSKVIRHLAHLIRRPATSGDCRALVGRVVVDGLRGVNVWRDCQTSDF